MKHTVVLPDGSEKRFFILEYAYTFAVAYGGYVKKSVDFPAKLVQNSPQIDYGDDNDCK